MNRAYIIGISSQKGGVGKTTIAVNLAAALALRNYKVLLIDNDTITPSVGFYVGLEDVNVGIRDVMENRVDIKRAIIRHDTSGVDVLPGTLKKRPLVKESEIINLLRQVRKLTDYDFIIVDTAPGFYFPEAAVMYDEAMVVSTPTSASLISAVRLGDLYDRESVKHSLVINKVANRRYEPSMAEMEDECGEKVIVALPEDPMVPKSEANRIPEYIADDRAPFSRELDTLVRFMAAKRGGEPQMQARGARRVSLFSFFRRLFGG